MASGASAEFSADPEPQRQSINRFGNYPIETNSLNAPQLRGVFFGRDLVLRQLLIKPGPYTCDKKDAESGIQPVITAMPIIGPDRQQGKRACSDRMIVSLGPGSLWPVSRAHRSRQRQVQQLKQTRPGSSPQPPSKTAFEMKPIQGTWVRVMEEAEFQCRAVERARRCRDQPCPAHCITVQAQSCEPGTRRLR